MTIIIPKRRQERRNTASALAALNEVLLDGEWCIETDTGKTKLGDGVTAYNSLRYLDTNLFAVASGTNTITATFASKPVLYDGLALSVRAAAANTGAATFNPNSLGAIAITKLGGTALAAGDIAAAGHELVLRYRASVPRWELLNPAVSGSGQSAIQFKDEGTNLSTSGAVIGVNFVGAGVTATETGGTVTVTVPGTGDGFTTLWKIADEVRASSATYAADSILTVALAASTCYYIDLEAFLVTANANMDYKIRLVYSGTLTSDDAVWIGTFAGAAQSTTLFNEKVGQSIAGGFGAFAAGTFGTALFSYKGPIVTNTAGTLTLEWAQNTTDAANLIMRRGSRLRYRVIA